MLLHERLLRYVAIPSASDVTSPTTPSTAIQFNVAKAVVEDMKAIGISDIRMCEHGYVYGRIPGNRPEAPVIGFVAHMDTVRDVPFENIKTRILHYEGGDILLNEEKGIVMEAEKFPALTRYIGNDLIVTDGTTLMGADDKAGIAEILAMAEYFINNPEVPHGDIMIAFTPDEEIGRGTVCFDFKGFGADYAYTVDGSHFDTVNYENFNAATVFVHCTGKNIHPGSAKNKMINSIHRAMEYASMLPFAERPEHTEGYEGFYHMTDITGQAEKTTMRFIIRDHDAAKLEMKLDTLKKCAEIMNAKYAEGHIDVEIKYSYRNMAELIKPHSFLLDIAFDAIRECGGNPNFAPVRGGTDGAELTYGGLPTPNLGTGGGNYHSCMEYICIQDMEKVVQILIKIAGKIAELKK